MSKRNRNRNPWAHAAPAAKEVSAPQLAANRANAQLFPALCHPPVRRNRP